jgi:hypothetical protein
MMDQIKNTLLDHVILLVAFLACLLVFTILKLNGDDVGVIDDIMLILIGALAGVSLPKGLGLLNNDTRDPDKV